MLNSMETSLTGMFNRVSQLPYPRANTLLISRVFCRFDSDNGISVKAKGFVKPPPAANEEPIQVIEGSYTYYDHEGKPVSISYVADENGYRASGDAIPQPHEAIAKALKYQLENVAPARK